jgi:hypothetical protein
VPVTRAKGKLLRRKFTSILAHSTSVPILHPGGSYDISEVAPVLRTQSDRGGHRGSEAAIPRKQHFCGWGQGGLPVVGAMQQSMGCRTETEVAERPSLADAVTLINEATTQSLPPQAFVPFAHFPGCKKLMSGHHSARADPSTGSREEGARGHSHKQATKQARNLRRPHPNLHVWSTTQPSASVLS